MSENRCFLYITFDASMMSMKGALAVCPTFYIAQRNIINGQFNVMLPTSCACKASGRFHEPTTTNTDNAILAFFLI